MRKLSSRSDCQNDDQKYIVDSGASLQMMSKDALTLLYDDQKIGRPHHHYDRQRNGRIDGGSNSVHQRSGCFCHHDVVGRFTNSAISGFMMRRSGPLFRMEQGRVYIVDQ